MERIAARYWSYPATALYPDVVPTLTELRTSYRLGVLANQPSDVRAAMRRDGLEPFFEAWAISDDLGVSKPDPRLFALALDLAGAEPGRAVMVGDRLDYDVRPAKSAGMRAVWMLRGEAPDEPTAAQLAEADGAVRVDGRASGAPVLVVSGRRVLVVGGGFAGVYAAIEMRDLVSAGNRLTLVSEESFFQYQPFLPEVASGTIDPRAIVVPLRPLLRHATVVRGEVTEIDHRSKRALVRVPDDGGTLFIEYDVLVLTAGSSSRVLPIPGLAEHGIGFKTIQEAIYLRNRVLSRLDVASETADAEVRDAALTFVVIGGGYAGVEALGELEDLARDAIRGYRGLRSGAMRWVLVEAADRILPELSPDLAAYASERLRERGIEVLTGTTLVSAEGGVLELSDGRRLPAGTLVWTAGVTPSPLAAASGFPLDERGRIEVDDRLRVAGVDAAWAAGDIAAVPDRTTGGIAPPTAQHGMREGRRLGRNVTAELGGGSARPFVWRSVGSVCSLGRYKGVAEVFGMKITGFPAWFLHRSYHLWAMPTLARRVRIAMDWTVALLFPRDTAQLGSFEHPHEPFRRAAGA